MTMNVICILPHSRIQEKSLSLWGVLAPGHFTSVGHLACSQSGVTRLGPGAMDVAEAVMVRELLTLLAMFPALRLGTVHVVKPAMPCF